MKRFVDAFSLWIVLSTALALAYPPSFTWFDLAWINPLLGVIMLGMGLTLTWDDFARVGSAPKPILLGVLLQFTIMPLAGYGIGIVYGLEPALAAGLILVSCCPGGTASNVIAYIARADVALSVSMTLLSTLAAVVMTPFLTSMLVGQSVSVDAFILLEGTLKVILVPVLAGLVLRRYAPALTERLLPIAPSVAVIAIILIVAGIVAHMQPTILKAGLLLVAAVGSVHALGAGLGYLVGKRLSHSDRVGRTISIEVGMQNAGLGIALAKSGAFTSPLVALPCAFSGLWSCILGSGLAAYWSRRPTGEAPPSDELAS